MISAFIIDDEQDSIQSTQYILKEFCADKVEVKNCYQNPHDALTAIKQHSPDLLFLDIDMPGMSGFDLLKACPVRNFEVIFITAYNKFAIDAFEAHAADYLLKPVSSERLIQAVNKIHDRLPKKNNNINRFDRILNFLEGQYLRRIVIPSVDGTEYIPATDIIYIEADEGYSYIFLENRKIVTTKKLNLLHEELGENYFYRCHRSYLVNLQHIKKYSIKEGGYIQMNNQAMVPLARRNKDEFLERMVKFVV
jgi:two-component system, LytTR family, response regulator